jgi:hypothetical protein
MNASNRKEINYRSSKMLKVFGELLIMLVKFHNCIHFNTLSKKNLCSDWDQKVYATKGLMGDAGMLISSMGEPLYRDTSYCK